MRSTLLALVLLATLSGCSVHTSPSLDPLVTLIREQNEKLTTLQEQMVRMENDLTALKDRPATVNSTPAAPATNPMAPSPRYRIVKATMPGQKDMDAIYILQASTGRMITLTFNSATDKLELLAGREVAQDARSQPKGRTDTPPVVPSQFFGGAGFITARAGENEVVVVVDDANEKLLFYKLDPLRKRIDMAGSEDLRKLFR